MTVEAAIAEAVRQAVHAELEPVRRELAALREAQTEELLTIAEAARRFRVSPRSMQRWIKTGAMPSVAVGRARRVRLGDVLSRLG